ncbi:uncharacterized protein [Bemisia tabaci]|uniref:uncharacterized protein isoform X2 n=1 Tax=Bemisia tabaci TaxID=7038 RepID=UPI003B285D6F
MTPRKNDHPRGMIKGQNDIKYSLEPLLAFTPNAEKNIGYHSQESSLEKKEVDLISPRMDKIVTELNQHANKNIETRSLETECHSESNDLNDVDNFLRSEHELTISRLAEENKILKSKYEFIREQNEKLETLNAKFSLDNLHLGKKIEGLVTENQFLQDCIENLEMKLSMHSDLVRELDQLRLQVAKGRESAKDSKNLQQILKTVTSQRDALKVQLLQQQELAENSLEQKSNELSKQEEIRDKLLVYVNELESDIDFLKNQVFLLSNTKEFYRKYCSMKLEHLDQKLLEAESLKCLLSDMRFNPALRNVKMTLHMVEYFQEANIPPSRINLLMNIIHTALCRLSREMDDLYQTLYKAFDSGDPCHKHFPDPPRRSFSDPDIFGKNLTIDSSKSHFFTPKSMLMELCPDDKPLVEKLFSSKLIQEDEGLTDESMSKQSWLDELEIENQRLKIILSNTNKEVEQLNGILSENRKTLENYQNCTGELRREIETLNKTHGTMDDNCCNQIRSTFSIADEFMWKSIESSDSPYKGCQNHSISNEKQNVGSLSEQFLVEKSKNELSRRCPLHFCVDKVSKKMTQKSSVSLSLTEDLYSILRKLGNFPSLHQIFRKYYSVLRNLFLNFQIKIEPKQKPTNDMVIIVHLEDLENQEISNLFHKIIKVHSPGDFQILFSQSSQENYLCTFTPMSFEVSSKTASIHIDSSLYSISPGFFFDSMFEKLSRSGSHEKYLVLYNSQPFITTNGNSWPSSTLAGGVFSHQSVSDTKNMYSMLNTIFNTLVVAIAFDDFCKLKNTRVAELKSKNASSTKILIPSEQISKTLCRNSSKNSFHELSKYSLVVRTPGLNSFQEKEKNAQLRKLVIQIKLYQYDDGVVESLTGLKISETEICFMNALKPFLSSFGEEKDFPLNDLVLSSLILSEKNGGCHKAMDLGYSDLIFSILDAVESTNNRYPRLVYSCPQLLEENDDDLVSQNSASTSFQTLAEIHDIYDSCNINNCESVIPKSQTPVRENYRITSISNQLKAPPRSRKFSKKNWFTKINFLRLKLCKLHRQLINLKPEYSSPKKFEHCESEERVKDLNETLAHKNMEDRRYYEQKVADLQREISTLKENLKISCKPAVPAHKYSENVNTIRNSCENNLNDEDIKLKECYSKTSEPLTPKISPESSSNEQAMSVKDVQRGTVTKSEGGEFRLNKNIALEDQTKRIIQVQSYYEQKISDLRNRFEEKLMELKNSHNQEFKSLSTIYVEKLKLAEEIYSQNMERTEESNLKILKDYQNFYLLKVKEWETLMDQFSETLLTLRNIIFESEEKFSAELSTTVNKYETLLRLISEAFDNEKVTIRGTLCESLKKFEAEYKASLKEIMKHINEEAAFSRRLVVQELEICKKQYDSNLKKQKSCFKNLLEEAKKSYERKQSQKSPHLSFSRVLNCNCDHPQDSPTRDT